MEDDNQTNQHRCAFATQVEALRRLRNGGAQFVRVEHIHYHDGAQAIDSNVAGGESMDKSCVVAEVHELVGARLFGPDRWLADREVAEAIHKKLDEWGLQESGSENTTRATPLGKKLEWDLIMVFAGIFNEFEVPMILEEHGLIDGIEVDEIYEGPDLAEHGERILRPIVQKAYLDHYNPSGRLH